MKSMETAPAAPKKRVVMPDPHLVGHPRIYDDVDAVMDFPSVRSWVMSRVGDGRKTAKYHMAAYLRWRRLRSLSDNPDQWIDECIEGTNKTLIQHLKVLKEWVEGPELDGNRSGTRSKYYTDIRGFYAHHLVPLPRSKLAPRREDETKVEGEVTATGFLKLTQKVLGLDMRPRDRSIILSMLQGGMDASTLTKSFNYLAFPQLVRHFGSEDWTYWDEAKAPVRVDLVRPKTDYRFYTFQDRDAVTALKDYLNARKSMFGPIRIKSPPNPQLLATSDPIYLTDFGSPIRAHYVTNLFEFYGTRAGVNVAPEERVPMYKGARRRYPFRSHEVRDTLVTLGRRARVDIEVVNFFVGHDIDRYGYDKSPWDDVEHFSEQYSKLAPYLNIVSQKESMIKEQVERGMGDRLKNLEEENRRQQETIALLLKHAGLSAELSKHSP
jgi:hypothetical protein